MRGVWHGACVRETETVPSEFGREKQKERDHLIELGVDAIILKLILNR
jgi:hypothetical protein